MVEYRCYILDPEDHIVQAYEIECGDDAQAASAAEGLLARNPYHRSIEVWEHARRITKLEQNAIADRLDPRRMRRARSGVSG